MSVSKARCNKWNQLLSAGGESLKWSSGTRTSSTWKNLVTSHSKRAGTGGFHFGCVDASLGWRCEASIDQVAFTFDGFDEGDQVTGRGWAKIEEMQMVGQIVFHMGDESGFKASKAKS